MFIEDDISWYDNVSSGRVLSRLYLMGRSHTSKELAEGPGAQLGNLRLLQEEIREEWADGHKCS